MLSGYDVGKVSEKCNDVGQRGDGRCTVRGVRACLAHLNALVQLTRGRNQVPEAEIQAAEVDVTICIASCVLGFCVRMI